jgi:hypothetical protein
LNDPAAVATLKHTAIGNVAIGMHQITTDTPEKRAWLKISKEDGQPTLPPMTGRECAFSPARSSCRQTAYPSLAPVGKHIENDNGKRRLSTCPSLP